eukprot:1159491-Pelagomonas_calceolata.AAC.23
MPKEVLREKTQECQSASMEWARELVEGWHRMTWGPANSCFKITALWAKKRKVYHIREWSLTREGLWQGAYIKPKRTAPVPQDYAATQFHLNLFTFH